MGCGASCKQFHGAQDDLPETSLRNLNDQRRRLYTSFIQKRYLPSGQMTTVDLEIGRNDPCQRDTEEGNKDLLNIRMGLGTRLPARKQLKETGTTKGIYWSREAIRELTPFSKTSLKAYYKPTSKSIIDNQTPYNFTVYLAPNLDTTVVQQRELQVGIGGGVQGANLNVGHSQASVPTRNVDSEDYSLSAWNKSSEFSVKKYLTVKYEFRWDGVPYEHEVISRVEVDGQTVTLKVEPSLVCLCPKLFKL